MARRPLPPGMARTAKIYAKVRPTAKAKFLEACAKAGYTEADGLREAASDWTQKILNHRSKP